MADQETLPFKDRSAWLTFFGVMEMVMGILIALFIPLILFSQKIAQPQQPTEASFTSTRFLLPVLFIYTVIAIFWFVMGIGSVKAFRWARAITLIVSWFWLIFGVIGCATWLSMLSTMRQMMQQTTQPIPASLVHGILVSQGIFMVVLFVIVPVILVLFYGSASVKATVERRDPKVRWTDRCPLPVLALSLFQVLIALQLLLTLVMGVGVPVFGRFLEGLPMIALVLVITGILLYLAWSVYHLRMSGWWGVLILTLLAIASNAVTFQMGFEVIYSRMGFQGKQMEMVKHSPAWNPAHLRWVMALHALLLLGFLGYVRRYFKPTLESKDTGSP